MARNNVKVTGAPYQKKGKKEIRTGVLDLVSPGGGGGSQAPGRTARASYGEDVPWRR